jgi:4-hydroxythreonine-4-phosphate dehydrogenase
LKIAISLGDLNGIGVELALKNHHIIKKYCKPIYCIDQKLLTQASRLLNINIPKDFITYGEYNFFQIKPGAISKKSGKFSFDSFLNAIKLAKLKQVDAIITLPISKSAWKKANILYSGHTDFLRHYFNKKAIMMLGNNKLFVALYTEHIALKEVIKYIKVKKLTNFFLDFYNSITYNKQIPILCLNPHCSDDGIMGNEKKLYKAIKKANNILKQNIFFPIVPDTAFIKQNRQKYKYFIALYHDVGLAPLKALYFENSINVSLNLPIIRASVDHGTAFDIAYQNKANSKSYLECFKYIKGKV